LLLDVMIVIRIAKDRNK